MNILQLNQQYLLKQFYIFQLEQTKLSNLMCHNALPILSAVLQCILCLRENVV